MLRSRLVAVVAVVFCALSLQAQTSKGRIGSENNSIGVLHAGGTVVVAVALSDGLVVAADSRLTITFPANVSPDYKIASDYTPKLFGIGQVAIATYGEAFISGRSIASYVSEFEANLKGSPALDVDETAQRLSAFMGGYYDKQKSDKIAAPAVGFILAGYDKHGIGKLLKIGFPSARDPKIQHNTADDQGATWEGQTDVISRLIKGYDPAIGNLPSLVGLPDDTKKEITSDLAKIEYAIPFQYMMLQDGIDFCLTLAQTTVDMQRFSFGTAGTPGSIPGVGGNVDVVAVTPTELVWVRRKSLAAK